MDSAAGHLVTLKHYRETGTTSKELEQESFVRKIKSENIAKLIERIHKIEHDLLPYIVNKFATLEIEKQNEIYYKTYNF